MSTAQRILIIYGVLVVTYGPLLGVPLARIRSTTAVAPRHLVTTHLSALMQGPIALGLAFALVATEVDSGWATVAAWVFVAGLLLEAIGGTLNWLLATGDQFAERPPGFLANAVSGPLAVVGGSILAVVVVTAI